MDLFDMINKLINLEMIGITDKTLKIVVYLNYVLLLLTLNVLLVVVFFRLRTMILTRRRVAFNKE